MIQSSSNSTTSFVGSSSSYSSISGVIDLRVLRLFVGLFDFSLSAFSITSRISRVLKTNFPLIATRFPFVRSLRYRRSSRTSLFSFRSSVLSVFDFSYDVVSRSIYRFVGDEIPDVFRIVSSSSAFAFRISVPLGGELVRNVVSDRSGVVGSREEVVGPEGISRVERSVIGENG